MATYRVALGASQSTVLVYEVEATDEAAAGEVAYKRFGNGDWGEEGWGDGDSGWVSGWVAEELVEVWLWAQDGVR